MVSATKVDLPGTLAGTPVSFAESQRHPFPKHRNSLAHLFMMGFSGFRMKEHVSISSGSFDMAVRGKCLSLQSSGGGQVGKQLATWDYQSTPQTERVSTVGWEVTKKPAGECCGLSQKVQVNREETQPLRGCGAGRGREGTASRSEGQRCAAFWGLSEPSEQLRWKNTA